jgi:hypothetical protein
MMKHTVRIVLTMFAAFLLLPVGAEKLDSK